MRRNKTNSIRKFERLEDRRMMAADIDLDNGVLEIQGTDGHDSIRVTAHPTDSNKLQVRVVDIPTGALRAQEDFDREDVQEIVAYGLGGNDTIQNITDIRSKLYGGIGNDSLSGGGSNDLLDGGANDDSLSGNRGNDDLFGRIGNDTYRFSGTQLGSDVVYEDAAIDTDKLDFYGLSGPANVNLASTAAQVVNSNLTWCLTSATGIENVDGSLFGDTIRGNSRNNVFWGLAGNDYFYGEGGDDELHGESDNDFLYGGIGNDKLDGGRGNDRLYGEAGLDNLDGGHENDYLDGGRDGYVDQLKGGPGQDTFVKHRKYMNWFVDYEQNVQDYESAVDIVLTKWY